MVEFVVFERKCVELLLAMAREVHPNEVIVLLHGKVEKNMARVDELSLPPQSVFGEDFASFNPYALPIDYSILGVAHSHPSGVGEPSTEDLNNFMGRIMVIVTPPYEDERDVHVFDGSGKRVRRLVSDQ
ncbi:MAG: Mov34/MPN/PAD-1 family protein [Candidatus Caldarchaeum sp.]|nr:Mov34/MPN/PAD-1 family protein [Candidatus Caldarchaeum sp.]